MSVSSLIFIDFTCNVSLCVIILSYRKGATRMSINQRVREVRQILNLSQAKFAKALAMSNGYVAGIELEHNNVNDRIIKLICFTFNVSEQWLRTGNGCMFNEKPDKLLELATSNFKALKPEYQKYIVKQIEQLLEIQHGEMKK